MKKVINCLLYNTETATIIASWSNGYFTSDLNYCRETLYKTRRGNYFLYGCGGAYSRYGTPTEGNSWASGEKITPLSLDSAISWAEEYADPDDFLAEFADAIEEA